MAVVRMVPIAPARRIGAQSVGSPASASAKHDRADVVARGREQAVAEVEPVDRDRGEVLEERRRGVIVRSIARPVCLLQDRGIVGGVRADPRLVLSTAIRSSRSGLLDFDGARQRRLMHRSCQTVQVCRMAGDQGNRFNVLLDDEHAARLHRLADRTYIDPGTLARSLLSAALDQADPDAATITTLLDSIPGARDRARRAYATLRLDG